MEITIRVAVMDDVSALQQLILHAARELNKGYCTPQQIESAITYIFGVDTQLISDRTYYVAEAAGQMVGCGGWSKRKKMFGGDQMKVEQELMLDPTVDAGRIRTFFTHPAWARQGIGRRIMQACEEAAKAERFTRLALVATLPGELLYAAMGYAVTEGMEIPMSDGITLPAAHMKK